MATNSPRLLSLATFLLSGLLLGLPWSLGGKSPVGQAVVVLIPILAGMSDLIGRWPAPLFRPTPLLLLAAILVGGSTLQTIYPDRTVQSLLLLLAYLLAVTVSAHASREIPGAACVLLGALAMSGTVVAAVGGLRLSQGGDGGLYAHVLTGPFGYPNAAAGYFILAGGAALTLAWGGPHLLTRGAGVVAAACSALGLLLTHSRGAVLAAAVGLVVWAAAEAAGRFARRRLWTGVLGGGVFAAVALGIGRLTQFPAPLWHTLESNVRDTSFLWRFRILGATWAMVRDHPWWGVGPGAFPVALLHYQPLPYVSGENPHNIYLELAAEYGLPFALLAVGLLVVLLLRVGSPLTLRSGEEAARRQLGPLLAALVGFAAHSAVDLDWSFPANAMAAAITVGVAWALAGKPREIPSRSGRLWNGTVILLLGAAALLSLGRYYAATLVEAGRYSLVVQDAIRARHELGWALRLNPLSFPAYRESAWMLLRSGDPEGALALAERARDIAPLDPNSQFLAGEIALAARKSGLAERYLQGTVERAPLAQLRYYETLLDSLVRGGESAEARFWYEQAVRAFPPEQVLTVEARCLAPGDRYIVARMSRSVAPLYRGAGEISLEAKTLERAQMLARPDPRGICATRGPSDQASPEAATVSFWRALAEGGWLAANVFLIPESRIHSNSQAGNHTVSVRQPLQAHVAWIESLAGGERRVSLRYELEVEDSDGVRTTRCAHTALRFTPQGWFLERLPGLEPTPCAGVSDK